MEENGDSTMKRGKLKFRLIVVYIYMKKGISLVNNSSTTFESQSGLKVL